MFKIGDFSKIAQVSIRSLRHYDKIGLFKPDQTDPFTGYRYYSIDQLPRLNRIVALKELGLTLEQVTQLVDEDLTIDQMREMLLRKTHEIREFIEQEQTRLSQLEQRLAYIEQEGTVPEYDIVLKEVGSKLTMSLRERVLNMDNMAPFFYTISQVLRENTIATTGEPSLTIYHDIEVPGISAEVEIAVPVEKTKVESIPLPPDREIVRRELPHVRMMASTLHQGGYSARLAAHIAAAKWMAHNHYHLNGPIREIFHRHYGQDHDADNMIEIQFPVLHSTTSNGFFETTE